MYDLEKIVHIRGVDHPESIGTAYTTDVAFAGPNRDILLAASLDNLVVHRFDGVSVRGLKLNHPKL